MDSATVPALPIPPLDATTGYLPDGVHPATPAEVEAAFVTPFATSITRAGIFDWWVNHRRCLEDLVPVQEQWVNGSFVTAKVDPGDIDIVSIVKTEDVEQLEDHQKALLGSLVNGHWTRDYWHCDSFVIRAVAPNADGSLPHQGMLDQWRSQWGHDRAGNTKGFVKV